MSEPKKPPDHNDVINAIQVVSVEAGQLSQLALITDVGAQRQLLLDRLHEAYELARKRKRLAKHGLIEDADCHAMIKAVEVAAKLTGCERAPSLPSGGGFTAVAFFKDEPE